MHKITCFKSPLRYPGGKTRAIKALQNIYTKNFSNNTMLISPFCGGCSFEFSLISSDPNLKQNILNDKFKPLITFYQQCQTNKQSLIASLEKSIGTITKNKFYELVKTIQDEKDDFEMAKEYFIINRCSFSGSTLSEGFSQQAANGRFTQSSIDNINKLKLDNIVFTNNDYKELSEIITMNNHHKIFMFCDPPYLLEESKNKLYGVNGDLHESFDHKEFHDWITFFDDSADWMITYNDCSEIRKLYSNYEIVSTSWSYGMSKGKNGKEIVILHKRYVDEIEY